MSLILSREDVFTCPKCGREPMVAFDVSRWPNKEFEYTYPRCHKVTVVVFDPPPRQPTDPANKDIETEILEERVA